MIDRFKKKSFLYGFCADRYYTVLCCLNKVTYQEPVSQGFLDPRLAEL